MGQVSESVTNSRRSGDADPIKDASRQHRRETDKRKRQFPVCAWVRVNVSVKAHSCVLQARVMLIGRYGISYVI